MMRRILMLLVLVGAFIAVAAAQSASTSSQNGAVSPDADTPTTRSGKQHHRLAVIVPYRDRADHLKIFAPYMHHYLKAFGHDADAGSAKIFVVEQSPGRRFNRGLLLNYGAKIAIEEGFDYLALHDVDHLPVGSLEPDAPRVDLYAYPEETAAHLTTCAEVYNYTHLGDLYFGGVVLMRSDHFKLINGFSNAYEGWGSEDTDLLKRWQEARTMTRRQLPPPFRHTPHCTSRFVNLHHDHRDKSNEHANATRLRRYKWGRSKQEGLNMLPDDADGEHTKFCLMHATSGDCPPITLSRRTKTRYYELLYVQYG